MNRRNLLKAAIAAPAAAVAGVAVADAAVEPVIYREWAHGDIMWVDLDDVQKLRLSDAIGQMLRQSEWFSLNG